MADASNVWDDVPDWGGIGARRLARTGALGASVWELLPGGGQFVYHFHHGSEELLVVRRGRPTVRLHDGDRALAEGDVVLPRGPEGGHQLRNDSDEVARLLIVSTSADPDVAEYPDSGKVAAISEGGTALPDGRRGRARRARRGAACMNPHESGRRHP